jgi:adenylate cyclase
MNSRSGWWRVFRLTLWVGVSLIALAHASGLWPLRFLTQFDLLIGDVRLNALMPRTLDPRIVIVDVDEKSLAEIGRWPWSRDQMATLVTELFERQKAAVVGFDMVFAEPDPSNELNVLMRWVEKHPQLARYLPIGSAELDNDARFAQALIQRNVVLGYYFTNDRQGRRVGSLPAAAFDAVLLQDRPIGLTRWNGYASNLALLAQAAPQAGFFNSTPDADGLVRSVPLVAQFEKSHYESLALAMFRQYTAAPRIKPVVPAHRGIHRQYNALSSVALEQFDTRQTIPVDAHGRVSVPYRGPGGATGGSFSYVSAVDLLKSRISADQLAGKLILIGSTAPGLYDQRATPVDEVFPGVEIHASLISGLLDDRLPAQPDWARGFEMLLVLAIAATLAWVLSYWRAVHAARFTLILVLVLVAHNLLVYAEYQWALPLATPLLLTSLLYGGHTIWSYIVEGRSKRSLTRLFGSYVPPELVAEMACDPARYTMRAENRDLTIMFCDMRNFTQISERLPPQELRALINRFFSGMTVVIGNHQGTLDKYIGDALMAFWGAPLVNTHHALHAVQAALSMLQRLKLMNDELIDCGLPSVGLGLGLNTGWVCVGDMGSSLRRSYTVMGDAVNVASRIEALTRFYGVDVLAGESTYRATVDIPNKGFHWVEVDRVRVKGKQQCVTLFTPVSQPGGDATTFAEEMRLWSLVLLSYRLQDWTQAQAVLQALTKDCSQSPVLSLYKKMGERIAHHRQDPPPADWDGVNTFNIK